MSEFRNRITYNSAYTDSFIEKNILLNQLTNAIKPLMQLKVITKSDAVCIKCPESYKYKFYYFFFIILKYIFILIKNMISIISQY